MCNDVERTQAQKEAILREASSQLRLAMHKADFIVTDLVGVADHPARNRVEFMQMFSSVVANKPYVPVPDAEVPNSRYYKNEADFWHTVALGLDNW